ncbi:MAG: hypothetical protein AB7P76_11260 [Candidatus Melainabacteria bacterium]|nr:hypothetical protein [Vampirovibrionales bacterium]
MTTALLSAQASNGSGTAVILSAKVDGNAFGIAVYGTFGGGTVTIEVALDGTNYAPLDTFTAAGMRNYRIFVDNGSKIRATLAGATGPNINALMSGAFMGITRTDA